MLPLNRQDTRPSIHSWWSDSNPGLQGPTINLHAAAKPLMRRMYHRQALQLIKKNRGSPLSTTTLEIYLSYLPWKFISSSTKDVILEELMARSESEADAGAMVGSSVFNIFLAQMLESPDMGMQIFACTLLASLAKFECTMPAILELGICEQLMSCLRAGIPRSAIYVALSQIAFWPDGVQAVVDAKVLDDVKELLKSPNPQVRYQTCELVNALVGHDSTACAVLELSTCKELESLLHQEDSEVLEWAIGALSQTAHSLSTSQVIADAGALHLVAMSLESLSPTIRRWTCQLVGSLASHESTAAAVLALRPFQTLVSLLIDEDSEVASEAAHALSRLGHSSDGAQAIVDAGALDLIVASLKSFSPTIQRRTCQLVGSLASHESTAAAILVLKPLQVLVSLLSDKDSEVVNEAVYTLSQIALSSDGAQAIVDAGVLDHLLALLQSTSPRIRKWACILVANLTYHESTTSRAAVLMLKPFQTLMTLLSDNNSAVVKQAAAALSRIAGSLDGVQAIIDAGALDHVLALLQSASPSIREWTCILVAKLVYHESTRAAVLVLKPFQMLVTLLSDENSEVVEQAAAALSRIAGSLDGAQAIIDAGALDHISALLQSASPGIQKWTCILVANLVYHKTTRAAVLALKLFQTLVALLSDKNSAVVKQAVAALSRIAGSLDGAQAIIDAGALDHVSALLQSASPGIRKWTCILVANLVYHETTRATVLALKLFQTLVALLSDGNLEVVDQATYTLSQMARLADGAQAILDAGALDHISGLLESPNPSIRKWTCRIVERLANHDSTVLSILELGPFDQLLSCLQKPATGVHAIFALSALSKWPDGGAALAKIEQFHEKLEILLKVLPDAQTEFQIHTILDNLNRYEVAVDVGNGLAL
ncbi:hypothetical protein MVEN_01345800 [Mycena venus]|uniref:Vacuolar protein 8 n=1 Tax=Mycena venus TaxID=2733690 RepID=A0A8H7CU64_9AGAR|nr:hypothetical protein MVEN_01345800 [Mycena venus]